MKKIIVVIVIAVLFSFPMDSYAADESDIYSDELKIAGVNKLHSETDDEVKEKLSDLGIDIYDPEKTKNISGAAFFKMCAEIIREGIKGPIKCASLIMAVLIAGSTFSAGTKTEERLKFTPIFVGAAAVIPAAEILITSTDVLSKASKFFTVFIPAYGVVLSISGKTLVSSGFTTVMLAATQGIELLSSDVIIPLCSAQLSLALCSSFTADINISSLISVVKKTAIFLMSFASAVLLGVLGIKTFVAAPSDSIALRTVKFVTGSTVPVVGMTVSEAIGTVSGCLKLLKSNVAVYGIAAVIVMFIPVILSLFIYRLIFLLCAAAADLLFETKSAEILRLADSTVSFIIAIMILMGMTFIISVTVVSAV